MPRQIGLDGATQQRLRDLRATGLSYAKIAMQTGIKHHLVKYFLTMRDERDPSAMRRAPAMRHWRETTVHGHTHRKCLRCLTEFKKEFHFNFLCPRCGAYARATGESNYAG